jgi:hypothetical protein
MSATEIPILNPKNIVNKIFFAPPNLTGKVRPLDEGGRAFCYDPVSRIIMQAGSLDWSFFEISLFYNPDLDEKHIYDALDDGDVARPYCLGRTIVNAIINLSPERNYEGPKDGDAELCGCFSYDQCYGLASDSDDLDNHTFGQYPEYQFWPKDIPGRSEALTPYFLHFALWGIKSIASGGYYRFVKENHDRNWPLTDNDYYNWPHNVAVVADRALAEKAGLVHFPDHQVMPDGNIILLTGSI